MMAVGRAAGERVEEGQIVRRGAQVGGQLAEREKQWMWMPMGAGLPYALGWYSQSYGGQRVVWHYGQLNGYGSSLVVKIPGLRANLVVLSNSSLLSDAYHLESGDILRSPLGRSFLAAMVDQVPPEITPSPNRSSTISSVKFPMSPSRTVATSFPISFVMAPASVRARRVSGGLHSAKRAMRKRS